MPRKPRLFIANHPLHLVVRGHNRDPIIARRSDARYFIECLQNATQKYGVAVHAWVLMTNHLHLLVTPSTEKSLPGVMQSLGRRYARYFNRCYRRSGSLWEGRYKTSLIDTDRYLLLCYRYIELNPMRAGMVRSPGDYPWSSYHGNALGEEDTLLTPHEVYLALASDVDSRRSVYRGLFGQELQNRELVSIRRGLNACKPVGNPDFLLKVAKLGMGVVSSQ